MRHPSPPPIREQRGRFPAIEVPWSPGAGLLIMVAFIVIQLVLDTVAAYVAPRDRLCVQLGLASALILIAICAFVRLRTKDARDAADAVGLRFPGLKRALLGAIKPVLIGIPVLLGVAYGQRAVMDYLQYEPPPQMIAEWLQNQIAGGVDARVMAFIFLAVVAAPVTEELLFRAVLYLPMRSRYGPVTAALVVSLIFTSVHAHLPGMLPLFVLALIFTWLLEKTGTLFWPILAHAVYNGTMVLIMLLLGGQL